MKQARIPWTLSDVSGGGAEHITSAVRQADVVQVETLEQLPSQVS